MVCTHDHLVCFGTWKLSSRTYNHASSIWLKEKNKKIKKNKKNKKKVKTCERKN